MDSFFDISRTYFSLLQVEMEIIKCKCQKPVISVTAVLGFNY